MNKQKEKQQQQQQKLKSTLETSLLRWKVEMAIDRHRGFVNGEPVTARQGVHLG